LQREQPESPDVFAGIAACYSAMGRYDLARTNYEFALAYAPQSEPLLTALANALDHLGQRQQAAQVRREVASLNAPRPAPSFEQAAATSVGVPRVAAVTVKLPTAQQVAPQEQPPQIAPPQLAAAKVGLQPFEPPVLKSAKLQADAQLTSAIFAETQVSPKPSVTEYRIAPPELGMVKVSLASATPAILTTKAYGAAMLPAIVTVSAGEAVERSAEPATAPPTLSRAPVTLALAKPAAIASRTLGDGVQIAAAGVVQEPKSPASGSEPVTPPERRRETQVAQNDAVVERGPRLERRSPGEVLLITKTDRQQAADGKPAPAAQPIARVSLALADRPSLKPAQERSLATSGLRWMPLRYASGPSNVRLLNAARSEGLAARMRVALVDRGWRKVRIGNAKSVRQRSVVLYSPGRAALAKRLAAHLHCKAVKSDSVKSVVVLLGRDAIRYRSSTARA